MNFIIEFYKELETLDLIIFWGIIIVIVLLLIFSIILLNKNKNLKKIMDKQHNKEIEELPIKKEDNIENNIQNENEITKETQLKDNIIENDINTIVLPQKKQNEELQLEEMTNPIKTEKKFIAEEHVIEYNKDFPTLKKINEAQEEKTNTNQEQNNKKNIEIPKSPYQRNVLRERSLSQTSPIGLTIPNKKEITKNFESNANQKEEYKELNVEKINHQETSNQIKNNDIIIKSNNSQIKDNTKKELNTSKQEKQEINETLKKELETIENKSTRKTNIKEENINKKSTNEYSRYQENKYSSQINNQNNLKQPEHIVNKNQENISNIEKLNIKEYQQNIEKTHQKNENQNYYERITKNNENNNSDKLEITKYNLERQTKDIREKNIDQQVKQLLNSVSIPIETKEIKKSSEKYLEEVSRKLSEAEIPDEIERTDYELEQEENAIISYTELMEKKDSIQTIDEEEAIISIEELMNRNNKKEEKITRENYQEGNDNKDNKLYNLTEDEENDDFLRELKQFRNDL